MTTKPTIILVHGVWGDGSHWRHVTPQLHADGHRVCAVQNPLTQWARLELNYRPHAYQAVSQGTGIRRETENSMIGLATCRDSPTKGGMISDSNRDTTATDYRAAFTMMSLGRAPVASKSSPNPEGPSQPIEFQQLASINARSCHPMLEFERFGADLCRSLVAQMSTFVMRRRPG